MPRAAKYVALSKGLTLGLNKYVSVNPGNNGWDLRGKISMSQFFFDFATYLFVWDFKRGSVQPGCILGGLRFGSTRGTIFKFVWYYRKIGKPYFT